MRTFRLLRGGWSCYRAFAVDAVGQGLRGCLVGIRRTNVADNGECSENVKRGVGKTLQGQKVEVGGVARISGAYGGEAARNGGRGRVAE
jgi:hypothetical protein